VETKTVYLLIHVADSREQFSRPIREASGVSVEWCLVKPDWLKLRSKFEER